MLRLQKFVSNKNSLFFLALLFCVSQSFGAELPWINATTEFKEKFGARGETFIREVFDQPAELAEQTKKYVKAGKRTEAVLIWQNGRLLFEKYDREMTPNTLHISWSIAKSVMSLLYGIAHQEGRFQLEDSICKYLGATPPRKELCKIKIVDVLHWASGLDWVEDYEKATNPLYSSVLNVLYGEGHQDMARFVLGHKLMRTPGTAWQYSSGDSILAAHLLKKIWGEPEIQKVFREKLFKPIGITRTHFETDPKGTIVGAAYLQISPYDLLRIGLFVLQNGKWQGEQILEPNWMSFAKTPSPSYIANVYKADDKNIAGAHWWSNNATAAKRKNKSLARFPEDTFFAMGHWGQYLIVVPSLNLIAIRMGDCRDLQVQVHTFAESVAKLMDLK